MTAGKDRLFKMITEKHIEAVIIGFWRQGADQDIIAVTLRLSVEYVTQVILNYFQNSDLW